MWDRRKETAPPAKPAAPPASATPPPEVYRAPQSPAPSPPVEAPRGTATIGKAVTIRGSIRSEEDLYLDGQVEGTLDLKGCRLTVGPNGRAQSNITAREVIVLGKIIGNVDAAQKISIKKDGQVVGDIKTSGIVIDDEAYFKGSIDIVRTEKAAGA